MSWFQPVWSLLDYMTGAPSRHAFVGNASLARYRVASCCLAVCPLPVQPSLMPCQSSDTRRGRPTAWSHSCSCSERDTACRRSHTRYHASKEAAATSQAVSLSSQSCGGVCSDCHDSARSGSWAGDAGTAGRRTLRSCAGVRQPLERNSLFCQPCTHWVRCSCSRMLYVNGRSPVVPLRVSSCASPRKRPRMPSVRYPGAVKTTLKASEVIQVTVRQAWPWMQTNAGFVTLRRVWRWKSSAVCLANRRVAVMRCRAWSGQSGAKRVASCDTSAYTLYV